MSSAREIKPCPFCGSTATAYDHAHLREPSNVGCDNIACGAMGAICDTVEEAVAAWNTRVLDPATVERCARVAKSGWLSADYDLIGIADADMAMALCEHIETELRTLTGGNNGR